MLILSRQQAWFLTWTIRKILIHSHSQNMTPASSVTPPPPKKIWNLPGILLLFFQSTWLNSLKFSLTTLSFSVPICIQSPTPVLSSSVVSPASDPLFPFLLVQYRLKVRWHRKGWRNLRPQGRAPVTDGRHRTLLVQCLYLAKWIIPTASSPFSLSLVFLNPFTDH